MVTTGDQESWVWLLAISILHNNIRQFVHKYQACQQAVWENKVKESKVTVGLASHYIHTFVLYKVGKMQLQTWNKRNENEQ